MARTPVLLIRTNSLTYKTLPIRFKMLSAQARKSGKDASLLSRITKQMHRAGISHICMDAACSDSVVSATAVSSSRNPAKSRSSVPEICSQGLMNTEEKIAVDVDTAGEMISWMICSQRHGSYHRQSCMPAKPMRTL